MQEAGTSSPQNTRQRILEAAVSVFAQQGLEGATTRAIAMQAKVNEVTLFRHFRSKENLLDAVLQRTFDEQEEAVQPAAGTSHRAGSKPTKADLRACLLDFARRYEHLLRRNILLLRTLLGEIHRHREHEARVLRCIFAPLKAELVTSIKAAQEQGIVRSEATPQVAADLFAGMIFVDVLRRSSHFDPEYPAELYLETAVETFARGIEP